jgi:hypothetical protein
MTRDDDFIGQLEGYLDEYEGITPLPDVVRAAIRAELPKARQIGSLLGPMRYLFMTRRIPTAARYGLVAALIVVAAVLGASFLGRDVGGPTNATPLPVATPGELPAAGLLEPGTYFILNPYLKDPVLNCDAGCPDYTSITFALPVGWAVTDRLISKHRDQPNEVALGVWAPGDIYADPCHWKGGTVPAIGHTMPDVASTFENQTGPDGSTPTRVTFGGEQARGIVVRIELSVPSDLDISTCDQGEYRSWNVWEMPDHANSHHTAGQVDVVYFVDVDRRPLLIDASHRPAATPEDLADLQAILDSMVIDRGF